MIWFYVFYFILTWPDNQLMGTIITGGVGIVTKMDTLLGSLFIKPILVPFKWK